MEKKVFKIEGMNCASCVAHIEDGLKKQPGVKDVRVNFALEQAEVEYDEFNTDAGQIAKAIQKIGYKAVSEQDENRKHEGHRMREHDHSDHAAAESSSTLKRRLANLITSACFGLPLLILAFLNFPNKDFLMILLALGVIYAGREFFKVGYLSLFRGTPDMDTLVALGISSAFIYSSYVVFFAPGQNEYFLDVGIISTFILFGRYLEALAKGRASEAIKKLLKLSAKTAHKQNPDGTYQDIPIDQVQKGDLLLVKPGEKIPTDGVVVKGSAVIDESMVTGESVPAEKKEGDKVIGATINSEQVFLMRAEKVGSETMLSQIVKMVQSAQMSKAPIQKLVDQVSKYFVWGVIAVALITFSVWFAVLGHLGIALVYMITVLIIACPCALGLATPISIVVGTGRGAELGILIKNAGVLEKMHKISVIAFDKTGTITKGHPEVQEWVLEESHLEASLSTALALELHSEHPLAKSIVDWFKKEKPNLKPDALAEVSAVPGRGVQGKKNSVIYRAGSIKFMRENGVKIPDLAKISEYEKGGHTIIGFSEGQDFVGFFAVRDAVKASSKQAIKTLRELNIKTMMITGDNKLAADGIAKEVEIDSVQAEVLPADKLNIIKELQGKGEFVAMVGDGINDSPAIAQANVGIAMGTGTDVAVETGDVVLVKGDLEKAAEAIKLSEKTLTNIKQNLFWAFIYNTIGIPIAALGLLSPAISAIAMAFSSVSVVLNALRLKRVKL